MFSTFNIARKNEHPRRRKFESTKKNSFVTATKLGTTNDFFVASTKNFAAATKRVVD